MYLCTSILVHSIMKFNISELFSSLHHKKDYDALFALLFTEKERKEMELRIAIFHGLLQGKSQRTIAAELGTGIATVTRGVKAWRLIDPTLQRHLLNFFHTHDKQ